MKGKSKLRAAVDDHQARVIIPHCAVCTKPCCALDELVLELDWRRARTLYQIKGTRSAFDQRVHEGSGPPELKEARGLYYAHSKPCPAYVDRKCAVYGTDIKPPGCSDFPLYVDGDAVTADRRCEAVDIHAIQRDLENAMGRQLERTIDPHHPMFVTFDVISRVR
jgi:Fe-S-cluster containining protein